MNTVKMGAFIRELRKEKEMTQKDLADRLGITDRAVSKWERGLNAPDLSTLEPLAEALGVTITELVKGERAQSGEEELRSLIGYSVEKTALDRRAGRRRMAWAGGFLLLVGAMVCSILWCKGLFHIVERSASPDGAVELTIYSRDMEDLFSREDRVTVREERPDGGNYTVIYGGVFGGLWWAPEGERYVLALETQAGPRTVLVRPGTVTELDAWLRLMAGEGEYRFCQWGADGEHMLIHYTRLTGEQGYFWCGCSTGELSGFLELEE